MTTVNAATSPRATEPPNAPQPSAATAPDQAGDVQDFYVEAAQADTIRVDELIVFTLGAYEIRSPKLEEDRHYPFPKDPISHRRLEGNLIEGRRLVAYNVRANVIEANHIMVKQLKHFSAPFHWPGSDPAAGTVRNKFIELPPQQAAVPSGDSTASH